MLSIPEYTSAKKVFFYFEQISKIPHGSGNTEKIADYIENFARERGLFSYRDKFDNVVIRKAATKGFESRPTVILQGHVDMVEAKAPGCDTDMKTEGLRIYRDGDFLRAEGTTLGGDDGVAVAYALALLDSDDISHPEIEAVFTTDEEVGLTGAEGLDIGILHGKMMINIDSDIEGTVTAGCAGGEKLDVSFPIEFSEEKQDAVRLTLLGLRGGHSGTEINTGKENAIRLLAELLCECPNVRIAALDGGNADNAIPKQAEVLIDKNSVEPVRAAADRLIRKYGKSEEKMSYVLKDEGTRAAFFTDKCKNQILSFILMAPNGVVKMSEDLEGLVETSLNLGVAKSCENTVELQISVRSSKESEKHAVSQRVLLLAKEMGAEGEVRNAYPGWEYRRDSHLRKVACEVFERLYNKEMKVLIIHAGLECGIFSDKIDGLDCISIGPDNFSIHTPDEHLSISSTARVWDYLCEVLKSI